MMQQVVVKLEDITITIVERKEKVLESNQMEKLSSVEAVIQDLTSHQLVMW